MQGLRSDRLRKEWRRAWAITLSLQGVRMQFHDDQGARQAACDEGLAVLLYTMGNMSFCGIGRLLDVSAVSVINWVRTQAEALPEAETPADVQIVMLDKMHHFLKKKTEKLWLWRTCDPVRRRTLSWILGRRDDATCCKLLEKIGAKGRIFVTDDWEGYHRNIPEAQLFTGKDLTVPIEQGNSNVRHYLARFRRRTKVVSRSIKMVDLSLRLLHYLQEPQNYSVFSEKFLSVLS